MKLNLICTKLHKKTFKNLKFGLLRILGILKPKNVDFFRNNFLALGGPHACVVCGYAGVHVCIHL